jgi:hypothetical protein
VNLPKEPFSWDGPDESPVPLDDELPARGDIPNGSSPGIVEETEVLVRAAQDSIATEDTDPSIPVAAAVDSSDDAAELAETSGSRSRLRFGPGSKRIAIALVLAAACAGAFAQGWHHGGESLAIRGGDRVSQSAEFVGQFTDQGPSRRVGQASWKEAEH